jgi:hypothetical protein
MQVSGKRSVASLLTVLLAIGWYVVALVLVLTLCLVAASPFVDLPGGEVGVPVSLSLDASTHTVTAPALGISNARVNDLRGTLIVPAAGTSLIAPAAAAIGILLVALWVLGELRALFRTLRDGRPFVPANVARVRRVAWVVLLSEPVRALLDYAVTSAVATYFSAPGVRFDVRPDVNVLMIVSGLIVLAIAEVFAAGTRLDEDQSLTV